MKNKPFSAKTGIKDTDQAIKVLDGLVRSVDKTIAVAQKYKQKAVDLHSALVKGKAFELKNKAMGAGQEVGWLIEHPAQAIGKVYDKYKEAQQAVEEYNRAMEQCLKKQKEVKEQQERRRKK